MAVISFPRFSDSVRTISFLWAYFDTTGRIEDKHAVYIMGKYFPNSKRWFLQLY
jgi:hypothetical protein